MDGYLQAEPLLVKVALKLQPQGVPEPSIALLEVCSGLGGWLNQAKRQEQGVQVTSTAQIDVHRLNGTALNQAEIKLDRLWGAYSLQVLHVLVQHFQLFVVLLQL